MSTFQDTLLEDYQYLVVLKKDKDGNKKAKIVKIDKSTFYAFSPDTVKSHRTYQKETAELLAELWIGGKMNVRINE